MESKSCPVCSTPYINEPFCKTCSWDLSLDIYWLGDTKIPERQIRERLTIAKENWRKLELSNNYIATTVKFAKLFTSLKAELNELRKKRPSVENEINRIIEKIQKEDF